LLEKAATDKDFKVCATLTKNLKKLRKLFNLSDSLLVLQHYNLDLFNRIKLAAHPTEIEATETAETKLHCTHARTKEIMALPETQLFVYILVQVKLIDDGDFKNVRANLSVIAFIGEGVQ
jgi:hypothetical protein